MNAAPSMGQTRVLLAAGMSLVALLLFTGMHPYDRTTWWLEVFPVIIALPLLGATYRRFPLSSVLYVCIFVHALVLITGGSYTYARVPLGFELEQWLHVGRNPYDKIGHFMQGLVPALLAREIFIRGAYVCGRRMLAFVTCCVVLAISALYEIIEWTAAVLLGQGADAFLGTQGDVWDTQSDMLFALIGAITALLLLARLQDGQIRRLAPDAHAALDGRRPQAAGR